MARKSKLLAALDAHKGRDYKLEKQKSLQKKAEKRKRSKQVVQHTENGHKSVPQPGEESAGWESDESEDESTFNQQPEQGQSRQPGKVNISSPRRDGLNVVEHSHSAETVVHPKVASAATNKAPQGPVADSLHVGNGDSDGGIPLSDIESLSSDEKGDLVPHQRLTINNTSFLIKAHKSIAAPLASLPFSAHQCVTSSTQISIPDINDDLNRELIFYKQCLDAATEARSHLFKEGVPFTRPTDYFAEMVKSDEHMQKIRAKMTEEAVNKKAAAEARRQRDLKKFGKQVQVAKLQERDKARRETLDKINILKRKRKDADTTNANEEDLFDVALEDVGAADTRPARRESKSTSRNKRQKKEEKFGFGGKKRFAKSGDAVSTGDLRGFSSKKMKGSKRAPQRLGKSRRARS
ncbi:rRNA-processing protein and EBNA1-binding protein ebp2 [Lambiella insularis]|nr:rRNA-processing protein and EBNA1-binding protein ebp2 [Lambiella insularis]